MDLISPRFSKDLKHTQGIATEFEEFTAKPLRRILKLNIPSQEESSAKKHLQELYDFLPRFGPFYDGDDPLMSSIKEAAWHHVLSRSPTPEHETAEIYMASVRRIRTQARNTYPNDTRRSSFLSLIAEDRQSQSTTFLMMMVKDGCLIIQIVLFLLGGSAHMEYPSDHLIFGEQRNTNQISKWARSLFFVGNQVPQVVLKELMKQTFFQKVLSARRWERPSDSFKRALYDLLLAPEVKRLSLLEGLQVFWSKTGFFQPPHHHQLQQTYSDLLHGLHLLVIGEGDRESDEEGEDELDGDLEDDSEDFTRINPVRSATELKQAGIHFKNAKGMGIRGIKFSRGIFSAVLALPMLEVNDDTELVFRYMQYYEITQPLARNKREVRSYVQFMSELVLTSDDAKLLYAKGIIQANRNQRQKLPAMLRSLASGDSTHSLRIVRLQTEDYSKPPWEKLSNFLSVVLLLTVLQTVYSVLAYYKN